jgi:hypothetical protein
MAALALAGEIPNDHELKESLYQERNRLEEFGKRILVAEVRKVVTLARPDILGSNELENEVI